MAAFALADAHVDVVGQQAVESADEAREVGGGAVGHLARGVALAHLLGGAPVDVVGVEVAARVGVDDRDEGEVGDALADFLVVDAEDGGVGLRAVVAVGRAAAGAAILPQLGVLPAAAVGGVEVVAAVARLGQPLRRAPRPLAMQVEPRPAEVAIV